MVDFALTKEQLAWREFARDFTKTEILGRKDLDTHGHFPWDLYKKAFDAGFITSVIPKEYGGRGKSALDIILAVEQTSYGDLGFTTSCFLLKLAVGAILQFGTKEQKKRWLSPMCEELRFASHAWTEPEGSANLVGRPATTTATPVSGGYIINGVKSTISNATVSSLYTVFARMDDKKADLSCFVIPRNSEGVSVSEPYRKMGQRAADTGEVTFENVFVPKEDMLGLPGQGIQIGLRCIRPSRVGVGAMAVGVGTRARDLVKLHGHDRIVGDGSPLIQQQDFQFRIADMDMEIEVIRSLVWRASWEVEKGKEATRFASIAKLAGGQMATRVTNNALNLLGGKGYLEEGEIEKLVRDAKILQIYEGPESAQRMMIAETAVRLGSLRSL